MSHVERATERALDFLARSQCASGEFRTVMATDPSLRKNHEVTGTVFATAIVLHTLQYAREGNPRVETMRAKSVDFLLSQMEGAGIWRFSTREDRRSYPPDVDDTAFVSWVLNNYFSSRPDADRDVVEAWHAIMAANRASIEANRDLTGLFRTWLVHDGAANDIDSVVNANVLLYLGEVDSTRAARDHLIHVIESAQEHGSYWYYLCDEALHYAVTRAAEAGVWGLKQLDTIILERTHAGQRPDGGFGDNDLVTALALGTLFNLGDRDTDSTHRGIEALVRRQAADGSWQRMPYYGGPPPPGPISIWFGSEEISTALCLEPLLRSLAL